MDSLTFAVASFSISRLYFTSRTGEAVWPLPYRMEADAVAPERLRLSGENEG